MTRAVLGGVLAATLLATPAVAQTSSWNGLSDRFQIDTGYFRLNSDTRLRYNGSANVDFERDLGVDENVDTFWVDGTWRVGRRHQLKLGYTQLNRDRADFALERDFSWGGEDYKAGLSATTSTALSRRCSLMKLMCRKGASAGRSRRRWLASLLTRTPCGF